MVSDRGVSAVGLLVVLLILAIAVVMAMPWLMRSEPSVKETAPVQTIKLANEAGAMQTLRAIHSAEQAFFASDGVYGDLSKLRNSNLVDSTITESGFLKHGYRFSHSVNGLGRGWCAAAVPETGTGRTLGIDQTGRLFQALTSSAPCNGGALDTSGGR